ncbi:MAG: twin-arginine translocase TatA/TatE family subunit [Hyphomicrobiales bacterium]|nr:MAG: twin-arginine translocase TatA/TatE family subunit [Hyphomicrobiales bacterium]
MSIGIWQIVIIAVVVVLLFGRGKISELMGDVAKGIKSFKKGLNEPDDDTTADASSKTIEHKSGDTVSMNKAEDQSKAG